MGGSTSSPKKQLEDSFEELEVDENLLFDAKREQKQDDDI
jgi:hypothetical protein